MAVLPVDYQDASTPTGALTELPATTTRGLNAINGQINQNTTDITTKGTYSKPGPGIPSSDMTAAVQTSLGLANTALQTATSMAQDSDYIISISGSTVTAAPRPGSGLSVYSGTNASTVIQSAINALTPTGGGLGSAGGKIFIARGTYVLGTQLSVVGWEGAGAGGGNWPNSKLVIEGAGFSTILSQSTSGQNAIIVSNAACVDIKNLAIFNWGAGTLSCIRGSNTGATSEISFIKCTLDNVQMQSTSTTAPCLWLQNMFDLSCPWLEIMNVGGHHGVVLEDTSTTINYGNSHFGFLRSSAKTTTPYAALQILGSSSGKQNNLITIDNYETIQGYYGIYCKNTQDISIGYVDIEATTIPIYLDNPSWRTTVFDGWLTPNGANPAVYATSGAHGNYIRAYIPTTGSDVPVHDDTNAAPGGGIWPSTYDLRLANTAQFNRCAILHPQYVRMRAVCQDGFQVENHPVFSLYGTAASGAGSFPAKLLANGANAAAQTLTLPASTTATLMGKVGVPATVSSAGTVGEMAADASWLYICTATNTWRRVAIASF